ncbi:hypothetical protein D3C72_1651400 [compost metagenome]
MDEIKAELDKQLNSVNGDVINRAVNNLNGDIYSEPWCKPLLFTIEYNQLDNPSYYSMGDRNIQTEHILPRAYNDQKGWEFVNNIPGIEDWINSGANLTLLSGSKNRDARNYRFEVKLKTYDGTGLEDFNDKKISSFKITQQIVNDFNAEKYNKEWNVEALNGRWLWFCKQVEDILEIDLSRIKQNLLPQ